MYCKRLSSPRCRSELIDSAWVVLLLDKQCIKKKIFRKTLDSSTLRRYFESVGKTDAELSPLLNPADKQNVPLAVKLLQLFIDGVDHQNLPPGLRDVAPAFQVMKVVCKSILSFFAYPKSSSVPCRMSDFTFMLLEI